MTITIRETILSGNMGDGWKDENAAAAAFAEFLTTELQWAFPDAVVNIRVQRNTSGHTPGVQVDGGNEATESDAQAVSLRAWNQFCDNAPDL